MKDTVIHYVYCVSLFLFGFVVALNLSRLVDTNPDFKASWWQVAFFICFAFFTSFTLKYRNKD